MALASLGLPPAVEHQRELLPPADWDVRPPAACRASKRPSAALSPATAKARTGAAKPFKAEAPRSQPGPNVHVPCPRHAYRGPILFPVG